MNKKYGIGFLVGAIVFVVLFVVIYRMSHDYALEKYQSQQNKTVAETELCYYLMSVEGYVTVFKSDKKTVYEYTTIRVDELPKELQQKLVEGLKLTSLGQVYGFLENYSS